MTESLQEKIKELLGKDALVTHSINQDCIVVQYKGNLCDNIKIPMLEIRNQGLQTGKIIEDFKRLACLTS